MLGAGVLFHDETHVLGGYQPKIGFISGIGGKMDPSDINIKGTALREMVEELFGYTNTAPIVDSLLSIQEEKILQNGTYSIYVFSIYQLYQMLHVISTFHIQSPYYDIYPITIQDLIYKRKYMNQEVTKLYLLPHTRTQGLSLEFIKDIQSIHTEQ